MPAAVLALTAAAAALRFLRLGRQSLWFDEVVTWNLLHRSLPSMLLHGIPGSESTPPLYYLLAWGWVRLFGWGAAALRSLSALAGTATVPVLFLAGRRLAGNRGGLAVAAATTASPFLVWYAQEARAYALFALLAAVSLYLFVRARQQADATLWAWSGVCVLALATHYFALFLVTAEALLLVRAVPRRRLLAALAAPALACLVLAPLVYLQRGHPAGLASTAGLGARLVQTAAWSTTAELHSTVAWSATAVAAAAGVVLLVLKRSSALALLAVAATAFSLPVALAAAGHDYVFFRNFIAVWLAVLLAVAAGLGSHRLGVLALLVVLVVFAASDASIWTSPREQRDDYRGLLARARPAPGTVLVVYPGWDAVALRHYDPALHPLRPGPVSLRRVEFVGVRSDYGAWRPPRRLRLSPPHSLEPAGSSLYQHFLLRRYGSSRPLRLAARRLRRLVGAPRPRVPHVSLLRQGTNPRSP